MNICADCGQPTNRGITASKTDRARCFVCEVARTPPPPSVLRKRARNRIYDTVKRRAKGMRQISR